MKNNHMAQAVILVFGLCLGILAGCSQDRGAESSTPDDSVSTAAERPEAFNNAAVSEAATEAVAPAVEAEPQADPAVRETSDTMEGAVDAVKSNTEASAQEVSEAVGGAVDKLEESTKEAAGDTQTQTDQSQ